MSVVKDLQADATVQHLSVQQISDRTGLDRKTVSGIMTGDNNNPKLETMEAIAKCLGGEIIYETIDSKSAVKYSDVSYYRTMIANIKEEIRVKDKWIRWLFFTCLGLIGLDAFTTIVAVIILSN